jgi:dienelactone hydrolase
MVNLSKVNSLAAWPAARNEIETTVRHLLGAFPKERVDLQMKTIDEISGPGYVRRRINYFVDEWERVSAWLFVPERKDEVPAIICCHHEAPQGKDEAAGLDGDPLLAFAQHYAELGYVTLAADCITAGDRTSAGLPPYDTKNFYKDYPKLSALGKMLVDHMCAVDVLSEVKRVDNARIGVVGHGLGGLNALMLAGFDERVQCCVASCAFTRLATDKEPERWCRDSGFVCLPALRESVQSKKFPFDFEHLLTLIAPSPTLVIAAQNDEWLGNAKSTEKAVQIASCVYSMLGASDFLKLYMHNDGRRVSPETLQAADEWFERWL